MDGKRLRFQNRRRDLRPALTRRPSICVQSIFFLIYLLFWIAGLVGV
jgi:hypothetical protein